MMSDRRLELEEETAFLMVKWIAGWGMDFTDKKGRVLLYDNTELQDAMGLLIETGVFKEIDQYESLFVTPEPKLKTPCDLEDILYIFYQLGDWYGHGVKYKEQGFKAASSIALIFEKLVLLGYCSKSEGFYFWTEKTFSLNRQGWNIYTPAFDEYFPRKRDEIFEARKTLGVMVSEGTLDIPFDDWDNDELLEKFVEFRITKKWRDDPSIWPDRINLEK